MRADQAAQIDRSDGGSPDADGRAAPRQAVFTTGLGGDNPYQRDLAGAIEPHGWRIRGIGLPTMFERPMLAEGPPDLLHIHWVEPMILASGWFKAQAKFHLFFAQLRRARRRGIAVVWTVHNLADHEGVRPRLNLAGSREMGEMADAVILHCETARRLYLDRTGVRDDGRFHVIPHASYIGSYDTSGDRQSARAALGLPEDAAVALFLGSIRPYKGVADLVHAFRDLDRPESTLVIAGKPRDERAASEVREAIGDAERIRYTPEFVPAEQVAAYMHAADVVVFPYRDVLTSGAVMLAMTFGKACVAPRVGCVQDTLDERGAFLYDPNEERGLAEALRAAFDARDRLQSMGEHNRALAERITWDEVGSRTAAVYEDALARSASRRGARRRDGDSP